MASLCTFCKLTISSTLANRCRFPKRRAIRPFYMWESIPFGGQHRHSLSASLLPNQIYDLRSHRIARLDNDVGMPRMKRNDVSLQSRGRKKAIRRRERGWRNMDWKLVSRIRHLNARNLVPMILIRVDSRSDKAEPGRIQKCYRLWGKLATLLA